MYKSGYTLKTDADFDNAILFALKIEVWQQDQLIGYASVIESHDDDAVKFINELHYLKSVCEFRIG